MYHQANAPEYTRRGWLGFLGAAFFGAAVGPLAWPNEALAGKKKRKSQTNSRIVQIDRGKRGTTMFLELAQAPFPYPGKPWKDSTVIVFVPHHYRVPRNKKVDIVVHFHGHNTTAKQAMTMHQLREQFADSKQNAILAIPQLAYKAKSGNPGKLSQKKGFVRMLTDLRKTLQTREARKALKRAAPHKRSRMGRVCISAHSGGYRAAAVCLERGGFEVNEVYLFDSLYSEEDVFLNWLVAGGKRKGKKKRMNRRKLISYYAGGRVKLRNERLMRGLDQHNIPYIHEQREGQNSRAKITKAQAVFIRTKLGHSAVTSQLNNLRDCLFASGLKRRLKDPWFNKKHGKRPLESRAKKKRPRKKR